MSIHPHLTIHDQSIYLSSINKYGSIYLIIHHFNTCVSFGASLVKNLPANAGDVDSIPRSGRPPGGGRGNPLQCSGLENPMDRERSLVGYSPVGCKESDVTE